MKARRQGLWLAVWAMLGAAPGPAAQASTIRALGLKALVDKADVIAIGEVVGQQARQRTGGSVLVTEVEFAADEVLKGWSPPGGSLRITHLGGEVDGVGLKVPGEVGFALGERALVFLRWGQRPRELRVVGMAQGKLSVTQQNGVPMVKTSGGHGVVRRGADGTLSPEEAAVPVPAELAELVAQIQALLTE